MIRTMALAYNWWNSETRKIPPKKHEKALQEFTEKTVFPLILEGHWEGDLEVRIQDAGKGPDGILYRGHWGIERGDS